jgi:hypothetical protein
MTSVSGPIRFYFFVKKKKNEHPFRVRSGFPDQYVLPDIENFDTSES